MRKNIKFKSEGLQCAGWLYVPDDLAKGKTRPAIVMAHGFSGVKELFLPAYADVFCKAGFVVMVFDYRFLGESEGEPRPQVLPYTQHQDYRNAITWVQQQPEVDAGKIGIWGSSYSGGHVLHLAAVDRRVKAVVSQVPVVDGYATAQRFMRPDHLHAFREMLHADRAQRYAGGPLNYVPVCAPDGTPCALPSQETYDFLIKWCTEQSPNWENRVTLETLEHFLEYRPMLNMELISPTPMLIVVATGDTLVTTDLTLAAYARAREPKALELIDGGHFTPYIDKFEQSSGCAASWFKKHLMG